ncbi:DUF86 domain-containing protein [Nodosilinea nodulosa]|uniref:HepT-like ribonuclease domain-containing protein n=1 Tax=Nodosilinea nodulosa TaxID=416001 RepID=UPI0002F47111|nr:DUF86 domain-containing protein [Nodosilinea nodulosa]
MSLRDLDYVVDILAAAHLIQSFLVGRDRGAFETDLMCQSAVIRQLEIIGEATKRLSATFRDNHPEIPWRQMAGMRDILIHAYDAVDVDEVWNVATQAIPRLVVQLGPLVSE